MFVIIRLHYILMVIFQVEELDTVKIEKEIKACSIELFPDVCDELEHWQLHFMLATLDLFRLVKL